LILASTYFYHFSPYMKRVIVSIERLF